MLKRENREYLKIVIACCCFCATAIGICNNSDGVYYTVLSQALGKGRGDVAMYATLSTLATGFVTPLVVKLTEKINYKYIACFGITLCSVSIFLMSKADSLWQFYVLGVLRGTGASAFSTVTVLILLGNWFKDKYGTMTGIAVGFSGIAGAFLNPFFALIIKNFGYKVSYVAAAAIMFFIAMPCAVFIIEFKPEIKGLTAYTDARPAATEENTISSATDSCCEFNRKSRLFASVVLFVIMTQCLSSLSGQFAGYSESIGLGTAFGATLISAVMVGNVSSKLVLGFLADRFRIINVTSGALFAIVISMLIFIFCSSKVLLLFAAFLFGVTYALPVVCVQSKYMRFVYGQKNGGKATSTSSVFGSTVCALMISVHGWLYDITGGFMTSFVLCLCIAALDILFCFILTKYVETHRCR